MGTTKLYGYFHILWCEIEASGAIAGWQRQNATNLFTGATIAYHCIGTLSLCHCSHHLASSLVIVLVLRAGMKMKSGHSFMWTQNKDVDIKYSWNSSKIKKNIHLNSFLESTFNIYICIIVRAKSSNKTDTHTRPCYSKCFTWDENPSGVGAQFCPFSFYNLAGELFWLLGSSPTKHAMHLSQERTGIPQYYRR